MMSFFSLSKKTIHSVKNWLSSKICTRSLMYSVSSSLFWLWQAKKGIG